MKIYLRFSMVLLIVTMGSNIFSQDIISLWEGLEMPYHKENNVVEYEEEAYGVICVFNVTEPELIVYQAQGINSGKAVVILPGGGYTLESIHHEGHKLAKVLAKEGITAAILKYRLPNPETSDLPQFVPLSDTRRALSILDERAEKYGINTNEIGVIGFSAGSHLATVCSLWRSENEDEIPDFSALIYGVTDMSDDNVEWLEESLYHRKMTSEELAQNTLLNLVTSETPSTFLVHAYDDNVCNIKESILYAEQLTKYNVPVEMHLFPRGGHGFGMGSEEDGTSQWVQLFVTWIKVNEF